MAPPPRGRFPLVVILVVATALAGATSARAGCNQIPGPVSSFRGALGLVDRPFAGPGDVNTNADIVTLSRDTICHRRPAEFACNDNTCTDLVTVVFTPPQGTRNAVVLTAGSCDVLAPRLDESARDWVAAPSDALRHLRPTC